LVQGAQEVGRGNYDFRIKAETWDEIGILALRFEEMRVSLKDYIQRVKEGEKTRTQLFEGVCMRKKGRGLSASCTLLKESYGDKVEKTFPLHSPVVEKIVKAIAILIIS
jgi:ribosomal protein L19